MELLSVLHRSNSNFIILRFRTLGLARADALDVRVAWQAFFVRSIRVNSTAIWDNLRGAPRADRPSHCQQKRQQRCWKGAGSGSRGVGLGSIGKIGIFRAENAF